VKSGRPVPVAHPAEARVFFVGKCIQTLLALLVHHFKEQKCEKMAYQKHGRPNKPTVQLKKIVKIIDV
jgi:hypothetical protein